MEQKRDCCEDPELYVFEPEHMGEKLHVLEG